MRHLELRLVQLMGIARSLMKNLLMRLLNSYISGEKVNPYLNIFNLQTLHSLKIFSHLLVYEKIIFHAG